MMAVCLGHSMCFPGGPWRVQAWLSATSIAPCIRPARGPFSCTFMRRKAVRHGDILCTCGSEATAPSCYGHRYALAFQPLYTWGFSRGGV